jgi:hypothetical protein
MNPTKESRFTWGILGVAAFALAAAPFLRPSEPGTSPARPALATRLAGVEAAPSPSLAESAATPVLPEPRAEAGRFGGAGRPPGAPDTPAPADEDERIPGSRVDPAVLRALHGDRPLDADHPQLAAAMAIQERHTNALMAHPGVVGTAVGLNDEGQVAILVLTKAEVKGLPTSLDGVPVVAWQTGEFRANVRSAVQEAKKAPSGEAAATVNPASRFASPVPIGVSTGHPSITAGTIGCRVKEGTNLYALSNNHVYADVNAATLGDKVIQPGSYDGGSLPDDEIGTLTAFKPVVTDYYLYDDANDTSPTVNGKPTANDIDAAIARVTGSRLLDKRTPAGGYGMPKSVGRSAALKLGAQKYGRTTGQTSGTVNGLNATINVNYGPDPINPLRSLVAQFKGQIVIGGKFSAGGDSGSLIVSKPNAFFAGTREPFGLLFAGSQSTTIANQIGVVLAHFGVVIDGE